MPHQKMPAVSLALPPTLNTPFPFESSSMAVEMTTFCLLLLLSFFFLLTSTSAENVTYDHRSLIIDGRRRLLISASIHYPRSVPSMWPGLVRSAKEGGADVIETYVFWNGHELSPGNYSFEDRFDLVKFVNIVKDAGMYLILRVGPFVAAEWNFGGIPVWLHYIPGVVFRSNSEQFKSHMQSFMTYIVNTMKRHKFFASQGGPIILAQVENEYGDIEKVYGDGGKLYAMWAADMALSQDIGVPWIMCQQYDAPAHVINTCNSFYCDQFVPNSPNKPMIWTENWPGWFQTFGTSNPHRPPEDIAFSVARFFQKGGSLQNYYMYHGGTNFGRTSGGPFITTSYDYDAPIDEYGLMRLPKWAHLKDLHKSIKLCERALLYSDPTHLLLGPLQEASVYADSSGTCAAFLANMDDTNEKWIVFQNRSFHLPAWSVSILPDCKTVAFNTAKVRSQISMVDMVPESLVASKTNQGKDSKGLQWHIYKEKTGTAENADFVRHGFADHLNTTKDTTDYLWYSTRFHVDEGEKFSKNGGQPILLLESKGHAVHVFVNEKLIASSSGNGSDITFKLEAHVPLRAGKNDISLLSMTVGLQNAGPFYEWVGAGLTSVKIAGLDNGTIDLSSNTWKHKIGLEGEHLKIYSNGIDNVKWITPSLLPKDQALTWYKVNMDAPKGTEPVGLDMKYMGKGQAWLNGFAIGRYWSRKSSLNDKCSSSCNYKGKFFPDKCRTGCGEPTQRWYHVPLSWFKPTGNVLVIFEEKGGDPTKITFSRRRVSNICSFVSEDYPFVDLENWENAIRSTSDGRATLHLACPASTSISSIRFASYGNPSGVCGSYQQGICHHPASTLIVERVCLQKTQCTIPFLEGDFSKVFCPGMTKSLAVEAVCS
ncbi:beta-galactosidase 3 isoform X2 [Phalaenopsis equestris]|uniref:beta-galactosidase 3 isoform X2 n=1 Tax=Phalaenopsis equestris TaxID=78828 RepID=UPI0009E5E39C|nr:beta-galactosidase 3 isoform X2 [Phalaenopsis equestris]